MSRPTARTVTLCIWSQVLWNSFWQTQHNNRAWWLRAISVCLYDAPPAPSPPLDLLLLSGALFATFSCVPIPSKRLGYASVVYVTLWRSRSSGEILLHAISMGGDGSLGILRSFRTLNSERKMALWEGLLGCQETSERCILWLILQYELVIFKERGL